jgi:hypothetical protein
MLPRIERRSAIEQRTQELVGKVDHGGDSVLVVLPAEKLSDVSRAHDGRSSD